MPSINFSLENLFYLEGGAESSLLETLNPNPFDAVFSLVAGPSERAGGKSKPNRSAQRLEYGLRARGSWRRQAPQFFHHFRDDLDRSFDIGIRIKPAKRKTQTAPRTILIQVHRAKPRPNRCSFQKKHRQFHRRCLVGSPLCQGIAEEIAS